MDADAEFVTQPEPRTGRGPSKIFVALLFAAFLLTALGLYHSGLDAQPYYDTKAHIQKKANLYGDGQWSDVIGIFPQRPLTMTSFYLNYRIWGMDFKYFRLVNVVILAATGVTITILIYLILGISQSDANGKVGVRACAGVLCGLFFIIHPVVTWGTLYVWQRAALLASFFYVSSLTVYLAVRCGAFRSRIAGYIFCLVLFECALLSKENSITLPVVLIVAEVTLFRSRWSDIFKRGSIYALVTIISVAGLSLLEHPHGSRDLGEGIVHTVLLYYRQSGLTLKEVLLTQCRMFFFYLSLIVQPFPSRVQLMIPQTISASLTYPPSTVWAAAGIVALVPATVYLMRRRPCWAFGLLFFALGLLPEGLLAPQYAFFGYRAILPMVGLLIIAADLLVRLSGILARSGRVVRVLMLAPVILGGAFYFGLVAMESYGQAQIWRDNELFWRDVLARFPEDDWYVERSLRIQALYNLGCVLVERKRLGEALDMFGEVVRIVPEHADSQYFMGVLLLRFGRVAEAKKHLKAAIKALPDDPIARKTVERVLENLKDGQERTRDKQ